MIVESKLNESNMNIGKHAFFLDKTSRQKWQVMTEEGDQLTPDSVLKSSYSVYWVSTLCLGKKSLLQIWPWVLSITRGHSEPKVPSQTCEIIYFNNQEMNLHRRKLNQM